MSCSPAIKDGIVAKRLDKKQFLTQDNYALDSFLLVADFCVF